MDVLDKVSNVTLLKANESVHVHLNYLVAISKGVRG